MEFTKNEVSKLERDNILPEEDLPYIDELLSEGKELARENTLKTCPFLDVYDVKSESEYKRQRAAEGTIMLHGQIGYRSLTKSQEAYTKIFERLTSAGYNVDRYGICLDWNMGYPTDLRSKMPHGTGLILEKPDDFISLTHAAPVAPHFGDFVIGTPAAVENTVASLNAGATSIGNLGQYFTFRMPDWDDDVFTTAETVKALVLCAKQPAEILVHSNLDDGFAALFYDMSCSLGAVLIEKYIVEELIGGHISHCYGHTFSKPITRLAFQRALARVTNTPGSMIYGNTTIYGTREIENFANLASYLLVDIVGQRCLPTGHGLNPVPITEAMHIPEIHEIIDAHLFANKLIVRAEGYDALIDLTEVDEIAKKLVDAGQIFKERVLKGMTDAGISISNPFELLLAFRRIGAKQLEELFGPGKPQEDHARKRIPIIRATTITDLERRSNDLVTSLDQAVIDELRQSGFTICVACTDVHEYGKILLEETLKSLGLRVIDAGISVDPHVVVKEAKTASADFIAISTYSGIALTYLETLRQEMSIRKINIPILVGGKLTQIPDDNHSSTPVDVTDQLKALGVIVCHDVEDALKELVSKARERDQ
ncbi:MAG: cobalamin-dependent protein [Candidatus Hodarchaeales archaeon]|jgi:methylmalonyl-CoA mutase cobalamin-binding subunit